MASHLIMSLLSYTIFSYMSKVITSSSSMSRTGPPLKGGASPSYPEAITEPASLGTPPRFPSSFYYPLEKYFYLASWNVSSTISSISSSGSWCRVPRPPDLRASDSIATMVSLLTLPLSSGSYNLKESLICLSIVSFRNVANAKMNSLKLMTLSSLVSKIRKRFLA